MITCMAQTDLEIATGGDELGCHGPRHAQTALECRVRLSHLAVTQQLVRIVGLGLALLFAQACLFILLPR